MTDGTFLLKRAAENSDGLKRISFSDRVASHYRLCYLTLPPEAVMVRGYVYL